MDNKNKEYLEEFNKLNKKFPFKLVSKKRYFFYKIFAIIFFILFFLGTILTVIAQDKINFENGITIITIKHEISPETLEGLVKYVDYYLSRDERVG